MHELRHSRSFGRFLAAWLLLWFVTMGWPADLLARAQPSSAMPVEIAMGEDAPCPHEHGPADPHAHHGSGSGSHCPLCSHASAPPSAFLADASGGDAPSAAPRVPARTHAPSRTAFVPPARGPPASS